LFIGLLTLVLAALAAILLARSFVAPTRRLIAAAAKVAAGDTACACRMRSVMNSARWRAISI
jgi:nitrogen fixation/metabolism regulation signal transduction histidine kinase